MSHLAGNRQGVHETVDVEMDVPVRATMGRGFSRARRRVTHVMTESATPKATLLSLMLLAFIVYIRLKYDSDWVFPERTKFDVVQVLVLWLSWTRTGVSVYQYFAAGVFSFAMMVGQIMFYQGYWVCPELDVISNDQPLELIKIGVFGCFVILNGIQAVDYEQSMEADPRKTV